MKAIILTTIAVCLLICCFTFGKTSAQSVYAETAYQSGFKHGATDGVVCRSNGCDPASLYILQPGNGFSNHSQQFIDGYVQGFCSIKGLGGLDTHETSFECIGPGPTTENNTE
jgi:hypothetical protein